MKLPQYYPVFLDLKGRKTLIIGGGEFCLEKVEILLEYNAEIEIVSTQIPEKVKSLWQKKIVKWSNREFIPEDLNDTFLAIVADTSNESLNQKVYDESKKRNVLLNVVDVTHQCSFITPAIINKGDVTAAFSTSGASPALARKFREILTGNPVESSHPVMNYAVLAPLLADVRNEIRSKGIKLYNDHWQASITDELVNYINDDKYEIARKVLLNDLLEGIDCECSNNICKKYESKIEIAVALKKNSPKWK